MNQYLEDLRAVLPPEAKQPTEEHIRIMEEIDATISGTREQLERLLQELESTYGLFVGDNLCLRKPQGEVPAGEGLNRDIILREHERRFQLIKSAYENKAGINVEDGGIKDTEKAKRRFEKFREIIDLSRVRIVCDGLLCLRDVINRSISQLIYISYKNHYSGVGTKYEMPFRAIKTYWTSAELPISTEIQYVTRRVRAILDLDHSFNIARANDYPSEEHRAWIHDLFLKASILDLRDFQFEPSLGFYFYKDGSACMRIFKDDRMIEQVDISSP